MESDAVGRTREKRRERKERREERRERREREGKARPFRNATQCDKLGGAHKQITSPAKGEKKEKEKKQKGQKLSQVKMHGARVLNKGGLSVKTCGFTSGRPVSRTKVTNGVRVQAREARWYPGDDAPAHLNGELPGDYGFDPLNLGKDAGNLARFRECEILHGRWAMLGALGCLAVDLTGNGTWLDAPKWAIEGTDPSYIGQSFPFTLPAVLGIELVLMAGVEIFRNEESDPIKRIYPGGAFDPMGYADKGAEELDAMKLRELKNGRLAMFAMAGFFAQGLATGNGPVADFNAHLAAPFATNIATNGVSVPVW